MEWMGPFVEVIHNQVYPCRLWACSNSKLVVIPLLAREASEWVWRVALHFPCGAVEEAVWDVR